MNYGLLNSICGACLLLLVMLTPTNGQVPRTIAYQGLLTDATGQPVAGGSRPISFALYDVPTGGIPLWTETQPAVELSGGLFSVQLGSVSSLNLRFDKPYWLGISVSGGAELAPRTELSSSPFALNAVRADSAMRVATGAVGSENIQDNAVGLVQLSAAGSTDGQVLTSTGTDVVWRTVSTQGVGGVSSLNGGTGSMEIVAGTGVNVVRNGGQIVVSSTGGSGSVVSIGSSDPAIHVTNGTGPNVAIGINPGTITEAYLANDAVTTSKLRNNSVSGDKVVDGSITTADLADNTVTSAKIVDGTVGAGDLADNSVTTPKLAAASVVTVKLADESVTSAKLADASTTTAKLVDGAVTTAKLDDGSVTSAKLSDGSATTAKLGDASVTTVKLSDGSVTTSKLGDASVTSAKVAQNAIDAARMSTGSATAGMALMSNGNTTPIWGNPAAADLFVPFSKTASSTGTLFTVTNTGTGSSAAFAISNASSSAHAVDMTNNGSGFAARVMGTGTSSEGLYVSASSSSRALTVNQGRIVLSYATVASGGTIGTGAAVVEIQTNNTAASAARATLPTYTTVENGTMIVVATSDPDGAVVTGTNNLTYDIAAGESRVFVRISNGWKGDF